MANPNWIKGSKSPNPDGRRKMKHSARTIEGMMERFMKRNFTPNKLQKLYDELPAAQKWAAYLELVPYHAARKSSVTLRARLTGLMDDNLEELHKMIPGTPEDIDFAEIHSLPMPQTKTA